jgi:hypothetical protein
MVSVGMVLALCTNALPTICHGGTAKLILAARPRDSAMSLIWISLSRILTGTGSRWAGRTIGGIGFDSTGPVCLVRLCSVSTQNGGVARYQTRYQRGSQCRESRVNIKITLLGAVKG